MMPRSITLAPFLIRSHFAVKDYNTYLGGGYPPHQFCSENLILSNSLANFKERELEIEEFLYELFELDSYNWRLKFGNSC